MHGKNTQQELTFRASVAKKFKLRNYPEKQLLYYNRKSLLLIRYFIPPPQSITLLNL